MIRFTAYELSFYERLGLFDLPVLTAIREENSEIFESLLLKSGFLMLQDLILYACV